MNPGSIFRGRIAQLLGLLVVLPTALGAQGFPVQHKASLEVVANRTAYAAGESARLAAVIDIESTWHINSSQPLDELAIATELKVILPESWKPARISYPEPQQVKFPYTDGPIPVYDGRTIVFADLEIPADTPPGTATIELSLLYQACDDSQCLPPTTRQASLDLVVGEGGQANQPELFGQAGVSISETTDPPASRGLAVILLLGVLGGLILNAMPCVLPVLSLKVFGLVKSASQGRAHLVAGALASTAGILVSFWGLALAVVLFKAGGATVGWGIQFQQPGFVTFLAVVVVLFSLNMWGLFEVPLPSSLAQVGGKPRDGLAGHFASGLFATLMATPCSAPFLGTAVGFALGQSAAVVFAVFTAVGIGLALPYLLLAAFPSMAKLLPKPGAWMNTLRGVMGFLLAAAAVWLFYVLAGQVSGERLAFVQLALLAVALFVWLQHQLRSRGARRVVGAAVAVAAMLSIGLAAGATSTSGGGAAELASKLIPWTQFDEAEAQNLAAGGQLVFVDVTADWCLTCKFNERTVLETREVADAFERLGVVPMKADWTNRDPEIADYLAKYGRSSIPFYALYRPGSEPHVFSELLTKGRVLEALDQASSLASNSP